jgi:uncharacterized protein
MHTSPVALEERATILDALRGFALLGVLIDNLFAFTGWGFLSQPQREALPTWPADGIIGILELSFIHGKFYSIFSLLFGVGFSVILMRSEQKGVNGLKLFYRRLAILMLFGAAHLFLVWEGDILLLYALVGMLLPLFMKCKDRTILIWAVACILAPLLIDTLRVIFQFSPGNYFFQQAVAIDIKNGIPEGPAASQYLFTSEDSWTHWRKWMEPGFFFRYSGLLNENRIFKVLGMFLLGFYAGRKLMYVHLDSHIALFRKIRKWGFIIGIPTGIATGLFHIDQKSIPHIKGLLDTLFYTLSVVPLCLAYVSWFCLAWIKRKNKSNLRVLAPMGRMALTNYLMQSILGIIIYYGLGFGLGGDIGPSLFIPLGLCVYVLQILYSTWWLKRFNYGPFEWLWRTLTYGKWLPMTKRTERTAA